MIAGELGLAQAIYLGTLRPLFKNYALIVGDWRKLGLVFLYLPIVYLVLHIQLYVGIACGCIYLLQFLGAYHVLGFETQIRCRLVPVQPCTVLRYAVIHVIYFLPRVFGYLTVYTALQLVYATREHGGGAFG